MRSLARRSSIVRHARDRGSRWIRYAAAASGDRFWHGRIRAIRDSLHDWLHCVCPGSAQPHSSVQQSALIVAGAAGADGIYMPTAGAARRSAGRGRTAVRTAHRAPGGRGEVFQHGLERSAGKVTFPAHLSCAGASFLCLRLSAAREGPTDAPREYLRKFEPTDETAG